MIFYDSKIVVMRGNSGSGKTTTAHKVRERSTRTIAIIEQDYMRRKMFRPGTKIWEGLIPEIAEYAFKHGHDVILEGTLVFTSHGEMLKRLTDMCPNHHFYYFDISFEETLRRHITKPNSHEFGEQEMREWYRPKDLTNFSGEIIIPEHFSQDETVEMILKTSGL